MKHDFYLDEDGEIDVWYVEYDYHNGPGCRACVDSWCMHCLGDKRYKELLEEECPDREPGLFEISADGSYQISV